MTSFITDALSQASDALTRLMQDPRTLSSIEIGIETLTRCFQSQGRVLSCGNGGSMCDAIHFAEELSGRFRQDRSPLPVIAVSDPGYISCVANDYGYEHVFSRAVEGWLTEGDVLLGISTSGRSKNVIEAIHSARARNISTLALLGKDGGEMAKLVDIPIIAPSPHTERIQEIHIKIIHILIEGVERRLFPKNYPD